MNKSKKFSGGQYVLSIIGVAFVQALGLALVNGGSAGVGFLLTLIGLVGYIYAMIKRANQFENNVTLIVLNFIPYIAFISNLVLIFANGDKKTNKIDFRNI